MPAGDRDIRLAALAALLVLPGCPLTDDYFVDPDHGNGGKGGVSAGGAGGAGTGGTATPDAASGGNGGAGGAAGAATGGTGGAGTGGTAAPDAASGGNGGAGGTPTSGAGGAGNGGTATPDAATGGTSGAGTGGTGVSDAAIADDAGNCNTGSCLGTCCGNLCVDLQTNPLRCGACTVTCSAGQSCVAGACKGGWGPIAPPPRVFPAREKAGYTVFDGKLFIFGGADSNDTPLGDGAIYDAATNTWKVVSVANAPSPRRFASVVWTGSRILVYGGRPLAASAGLANGAIYDPDADRWSPMTNGVTGRVGAPCGASTSVALFWGGWTGIADPMGGGERYDVGADAWQPIIGGPGALADPAWAFTGQAFYLYGGKSANTKTNATWSYDLASKVWTQPGGTEGPSARWGAFATWDGLAMFVWGGRNETTAMGDGKFLYSSSSGSSSWTPMVQSGSAPSARWAPSRRSGWAFSRGPGDVVIVGGEDANGRPLTDGARYDSGLMSPAAGWTALSAWPSGEAHTWGVAAYAGGAVLLWGGRHGTLLTTTGERWAP